MLLKTETLELRGIENKTSAKGNIFYNVFLEEKSGKPCDFYCPDDKAFPKDLKKGDLVNVILDYDLKYKSIKVFEIEIVNKAVK